MGFFQPSGILNRKGFFGAKPFSPLDIAGLSIWLDANDSSTITSASNIVSEWRDKSGSSNNLTPVSTGPTTNSITQNGKNALSFSNSRMAFSSPYIDLGLSSTFYIVTSPSSVTQRYLAYFFYGSSEGDQLAIITKYNNISYELYTSAGPRFTIGSASASGVNILAFTRSGNSLAGRLNGQASGTGTTTSKQNLSLKSRNIGGSNLGDATTCTICEILAYNKVLSSEELSLIDSYLNSKWAIY